jgi:hypothetical protein
VPRVVHLDDGFTLRFPQRDQEFASGVEIGILAVLMDLGHCSIARWIASQNLAQVRALAEKFGYRLAHGAPDNEWIRITLSRGKAEPRLKLVVSV